MMMMMMMMMMVMTTACLPKLHFSLNTALEIIAHIQLIFCCNQLRRRCIKILPIQWFSVKWLLAWDYDAWLIVEKLSN